MTVTMAMAEMANHAMKEPRVSLETASWWFDRAGFVLIAALVIGVICTALIVWLGIEKEHHWDLARDNAAKQIGELNIQAEQLRKDTAEANARTKDAELKLAELREKVARPRQLNQEVFLQEIKGLPVSPVEITLRSTDDPDSHWLAFSLWTALEKAGWPVIQSGTRYEMFRQTPDDIKACAGNFGGIRVLAKMLSDQDVTNLQAPPPRPKGTSSLIGLSDVLWRAVGENEAGFATCPMMSEGRLHVVVAPRWVILPAIPSATPSAEPSSK